MDGASYGKDRETGMRKTLRGRYGAGACAGLFLAVFLLAACSQRLVVRYYTEETGRVTGPVRLAVLTDLHSTFYGKEQEELVRSCPPSVIESEEPYLIRSLPVISLGWGIPMM